MSQMSSQCRSAVYARTKTHKLTICNFQFSLYWEENIVFDHLVRKVRKVLVKLAFNPAVLGDTLADARTLSANGECQQDPRGVIFGPYDGTYVLSLGGKGSTKEWN